MEHIPTSSYEPGEEQQALPAATPAVYPPKYRKQEQPANVWMRSIVSLAAYLLLGYYIFPGSSYKILLLITAIVIIHEMGHFAAMKYFRYKDLGIFFIPLLGAYVSGSKREVSQQQSAVILLAGPLPGIIIGIILYIIDRQGNGYYLFDISVSRIGILFVVLNLLNLVPIYPLDGGQLLNRIFLDEDGLIGKIFVVLSAALIAWLAWYLHFYPLFILPVMMLFRLQTDTRFITVEKRIEEAGVNLDVSYEDMPDADYWKARNILIETHPSYREIALTPPYEYDAKEEKIMTAIQSMLHRHLIQDVSFAGKLFIILIWLAAFAAPWVIAMDLSVFTSRLGF